MAIVLVALGGAVVDYVSLEQTRSRAQTALDAATLALQPEINKTGVTNDSILERAQAIVVERIGDRRITAKVDRITVDRETGRLFLGGDFTMPTSFVSLVGVRQLTAAFSAEALKGSVDLEVALALDITGSMRDYMGDLKDATKELAAAILESNRGEVTAKVALVPYSQAVNLGTYAAALRGPVRASKNITAVAWASSPKNVTDLARNNGSVLTVTSVGHGFANGDYVYISGTTTGGCSVNNTAYQVSGRTANTFQIAQSSSYCYLYNTGQVRKCAYEACQIQITSNAHSFTVGQFVYITDVGGLSGINNITFPINSVTTNTLLVSAPPAPITGTYSSNTGRLHCTYQTSSDGCTYYYFQSASGGWNTNPISNCVTERTANATTDLPPTTTLMGRNYPPSSNGCPTSAVVPLTTNSTTLTTAIDSFTADGSTAGALGALWGWYMLSPNFAYLWPTANRPRPYSSDHLLKAAVLMTDGDFNTVHCNGVVARNSTSGSGGTSDRINCDAANGTSYVQAKAYCDAMKRTGIVVYTVAFNLSSGSAAADIMSYCASSAANAFLASNGAALKESFRQIARNISALRLSQ